MMPDIEALEELIKDMGGMDYDSLKGGKATPSVTKIEMQSTAPVDENTLNKLTGAEPDGTGPHGKGNGPGMGMADGSGMMSDEDKDKMEQLMRQQMGGQFTDREMDRFRR